MSLFDRLANSAGWPPDPEKLGLLRPRPSQGCWDEDSSEVKEGSRGSEAHRQTDIYVLRRDISGPTNLAGFGQICWSTEQSASDVLTYLYAYEHLKNSFFDTAAHCASKGIAFVPIVVEAHSRT